MQVRGHEDGIVWLRQGRLAKERSFAEVRKQNEYQKKTLAGKGGLTSQRREAVFSRSKGKKMYQQTKTRKKKATRSTQKVKPNINIIYCPYFLALPQICICQRFPFVFAGKHNLILE